MDRAYLFNRYVNLALSLAGVTSCRAIEPASLFAVQKGPLLLKPQLQAAATFTDNLDYREDNKLSDFIFLLSPGLALQLGDRTLNFAELTYYYDRFQHIDNREFDANQHRFEFENRFQKSRFTLTGRDRVEFLSSPLSGGFNITGRLVDRLQVRDAYRLDYDLTERSGVYGAVAHDFLDYEEDVALYDSRTVSGTLGFTYKAFSRTFFFSELYYGTTANERNLPTMGEYPDTTFIGGFLGAQGQFTEKLTGTVKVGYEAREYETDSEGSGAPVVEASMAHRFTDRTSASITYSRRQQESVQFVRSTYVSDSLSASLMQIISSDDRFRANLQVAYLSAAYESSAALGAERDDDLISASFRLTYDLKLWMRIFGGYSFEMLETTHATLADYKVNRVTMGVQLGY
jgi:hypothetical protein